MRCIVPLACAEDNEYTKQLILSCLESITQHIYVDLHPKSQQDAMDTEERTAATTKKAQTIEKQYKGAPETIVQCIRGASDTPCRCCCCFFRVLVR